MRLPIDLCSPLPEPPRDVRTFADELAENLEWLYKVAREIIEYKHIRAENCYNKGVVERAYQPSCLVRRLQHARNCNAPSKLDTKYSGLCKVLEVRGALLALLELYTRRVFIANHDAVRRSTMSRAATPQVPAARAASYLQYCAPHINPLPTRCRRKSRRDLNQRSAQCPLNLVSQPL